jgi:virginiamycin B lyase
MKRFLALALVLASAVASAAPRRTRRGTLGGTVLWLNGKAVAGAGVVLQVADGTHPRATTTDSRGRFVFASIRAGLYDIRASAGGVSSEWLHNVLVRPGREAYVKLRLSAANPAPPAGELHGRVREWTIPVSNGLPHDPAVDPQGNVWTTLMRANQLAKLNPATGEWQFFPVPTHSSGPHGLVSDRDGNIWFAENSVGKIGRLDSHTGRITEYAAPTAKDPHTPVFGPDGALWFTAQGANLIVRMDTQTGAMREYRVPTPNAHPYGIAPGPDGALWFCEFGDNKLGRIEPETGAITEFKLPVVDARPRRLTVVGDAIYFTDFHGGRLGRFDLKQRTFKLWRSPSGPGSGPYGIAADKAENIWYEEFTANQLVRFDPDSETFTRFVLPSPRSEVRNMARDASGRIWMALSGADKLAVIQ